MQISVDVLLKCTVSTDEQVRVACRMCQCRPEGDALPLSDAVKVFLWLMLTKIQMPEADRLNIIDCVQDQCSRAAKHVQEHVKNNTTNDIAPYFVNILDNKYLVVQDTMIEIKTGKTPEPRCLPRPVWRMGWDLATACLLLILEQAYLPSQE